MKLLPAVVLATLAAAAPAHAADTITPPLHTDGARLVDARGKTVVVQGVNWFGFETSSAVVHGLWTRDYVDVLRQIRRLGFNTIRLPFSLDALRARSFTGVDFSGGKNAGLKNKTPLQAMDAVIDAADREGVFVLLENHSLAPDGYSYGLWYGQNGYSEDDWVAAWRGLARRYRNRRNVIGADLKNEPHGPATWGTGGPTDWRRAATRAGNAVLGIAPEWLIVVEGIEGRVAGQRLDTHWWGGNLEGVRRAPVRLARANRLVYSPHEYGPGVFNQPWFERPDVARVLADRWEKGFGYIVRQDIAPVLVGEFGGREVGNDTVEGRWQRQFLDYLGRHGISWTYWALNPNSGDTGGVLADDWKRVNGPKLALLRRLQRRNRIAFARPRRGSAPQPETTPAPAPAEPAPATAPAPAGPLRAELVIDSRWEAGWCAHLSITGQAGPLGTRAASFSLPGGTTINQSWNGDFSATTGAVSVRFPEWAAVGPYTATGFCVSGTGAPSAVTMR